MMRFLRKSALVGLLSIFSLVTFLATPVGVYAKVDEPKIKISDRESKAIVLKVKQDDLDKDRVKIKVRVENMVTGEKFTRTFSVRLNSDGEKKITITDLNPSTEYKFKASIKKRNNDSYSDYSNSKKVSTRP